MITPQGIVYLVGAGPGDPGLITVRGLAILRNADVIVHDRLIGKELLGEARPSAEIIDVGKAPGRHRLPQKDINELLIDRGRKGLRVVRLKGGDPFVFGRGYEELTACREAHVPCVVVPGVSSAFSAPALAGIPVSLRGVARSVAVVSAEGAEGDCTNLDYFSLARIDTVVILMGRAKLAEVTRSLMQAGKRTSTPAACIERATTPLQRVIVSTLDSIAEEADRAGLSAPIITVVGEVAALASQHAMGHERSHRHGGAALSHATPAGGALAAHRLESVAGKRVVITRPRDVAGDLEGWLLAAGATPISCPMIRIAYPRKNPELDAAIARIGEYAWIVFSSVHGVIAFQRRLRALGLDARALRGCKVAAVGPATAAKLQRYGIRPDATPQCHTGDTLARAVFDADTRRPLRVLFPRGDHALPNIPRSLEAGGAVVDEVVAYRTVDAAPPAAGLKILRDGVDAILFFSPSAVRRFAALGVSPGRAVIGCIGPTTARAAEEAGVPATVTAQRHSTEGLLEALERHFTAERTESCKSQTVPADGP